MWRTEHGTETERVFAEERMLYERNTRLPARRRSVVAFQHRRMSLDEPRQVAGTLDTCQEKDEIDARTNGEGKSPSS